jgi:hypothetical protein
MAKQTSPMARRDQPGEYGFDAPHDDQTLYRELYK